MDKIDPFNAYLNPNLVSPKKEKKTEKTKKNEFNRLLDKASEGMKPEDIVLPDEITEEFIVEALDAVTERGEDLKRDPSVAHVKNYRAAVAIFIKAVISQSMVMQEKTSGLNILKRKRYTMIQVVDQRLNSLATDILQGQAKQFDILARVDEIRGILVNLLN